MGNLLLVVVPNLVVLLVLLMCFEPLPHVRAQSTTTTSTREANALDAILQQYAYKALVNPKTGTIYNATQIPSNLIGIELVALRLKSGSLNRKDFPMYNDFVISKGLIESLYVERLVLVYQNLGNWSKRYHPFLVLWMQKYKQKKKMQLMERATNIGEALHMASIGDSKALATMVTRTQPTLEHEYAP